MTETEIIQQLWYCLQKQYTYAEAKIHIEAYKNGRTTVKKSIIVEEDR